MKGQLAELKVQVAASGVQRNQSERSPRWRENSCKPASRETGREGNGKPKYPEMRTNRPRPWYCFRCGEDGHLAINCENPPNSPKVEEKRQRLRERQAEWDLQNWNRCSAFKLKAVSVTGLTETEGKEQCPKHRSVFNKKTNIRNPLKLPAGLVGMKCTAQVKIEEDEVNCRIKVKHRINLNDNTPFKQHARPIHPQDVDAVRKHLRELLDAGVIRESESPFASPIVAVKKKNNDVRLCIDFRKLNSQTIKDAYALPNLEEAFSVLSGSKWFSVLDLKSGLSDRDGRS
ncbi:hypothetical protein QQF64_012036 [Cirrhinus molitorella]|uniref:CCHC-type domain-containing protein n=1 Tax=Cirrhinus molitorella TaxID=172907 RepID=A0ABR3LUB4_9TELE